MTLHPFPLWTQPLPSLRTQITSNFPTHRQQLLQQGKWTGMEQGASRMLRQLMEMTLERIHIHCGINTPFVMVLKGHSSTWIKQGCKEVNSGDPHLNTMPAGGERRQFLFWNRRQSLMFALPEVNLRGTAERNQQPGVTNIKMSDVIKLSGWDDQIPPAHLHH